MEFTREIILFRRKGRGRKGGGDSGCLWFLGVGDFYYFKTDIVGVWKSQIREYTEWQRPLSGVDSIMMEKLAQADEGGGCTRPPPFTISTITYKVVVYSPAERADTLPLSLLYPYVLYGGDCEIQNNHVCNAENFFPAF